MHPWDTDKADFVRTNTKAIATCNMSSSWTVGVEGQLYHRRHRHFQRDFNLNNRSKCPNFGQPRRNFPRASHSEYKQKKYKTENDAPITDKNRAHHKRKKTQGAWLSKPLIHIDPPSSIKASIPNPRCTSPRCAVQMDNPRWRPFGVQPPDNGGAVGWKIGGGSFAQAGGARMSPYTTTG